ncbi:MAG: hypothetical protein QM757_23885 [Paludibaculum sp.]
MSLGSAPLRALVSSAGTIRRTTRWSSRLTHGRSFLLTGDIEQGVERRLLSEAGVFAMSTS